MARDVIALPRCPVRACPVRWSNGGSDRLCRDHDASDTGDLAGRMALLAAAPGDRETTTTGGQRHAP